MKYNLQPSPIDPRDHTILFQTNRVTLPIRASLENICPPVYDQGPLGSCTGNAAATMYSSIVRKKTKKLFLPSRLFLYYNSRAFINTIHEDSGATLRDTMKVIAKQGVCAESRWPYYIERFTTRPSSSCYLDARRRLGTSYAALDNRNLVQLKTAIAKQCVFIIGILIYNSFESQTVYETGIVPIPDTTRETLLGGHAVTVIGYDDEKQAFQVRNSWGTQWGDQGNFWLPYAYITNPNLAFDTWVLYDVRIAPDTMSITKPIPTMGQRIRY